MKNQHRIDQARAYCIAVGKDPDEMVWGGFDNGCGAIVRSRRPRHEFMLGADPSLAEGAMDLSPEQVRRRNARRADS